VVLGAGAVVAVVAAVVPGDPVLPVPPVAPVDPGVPVEPGVPVDPAGTVAVGVGAVEPESPGFMTKMSSAVSTTTPAAPPMALTSSARGRPGFQLELDCREGLRRFVTSS
jgi:hypothetical protein